MTALRSLGDLLAASPHLTVLKNGPLSANAEKAEGKDDLLGLAHYSHKIKDLCSNNPYFTQILSDTVAHLEDKMANGPFEIIWGLPPHSKILELRTYLPWKPALATTERMLAEAVAVAKDRIVKSQGNPENGHERELNAAVLAVEDIIGGALQRTFSIVTLSAADARKNVRQTEAAKSNLARTVRASLDFTKKILFSAVDAAKIDFVASGEYEMVKVRTYAFGRKPDKTEEDTKALDAVAGQEIIKYMRSNPAYIETFGFDFKWEKDCGKWIATEKVAKNKQVLCEALANVPPTLELQELAAKAAIEAILNKRDPMTEAKKAADARIEEDALRVAKAVVALNYSGARVEFIMPLKDSLATMRRLLNSLKTLEPAKTRELSVFFESRLRGYKTFGLVVNEPTHAKPETLDIPIRPQKVPQTAPALASHC